MKKYIFILCLSLALTIETFVYIRSFHLNKLSEQKVACCIEVFKKLETHDFNQAINRAMRKLTRQEQSALMPPLGFRSGDTYAWGAVALWLDTSNQELTVFLDKIEFR